MAIASLYASEIQLSPIDVEATVITDVSHNAQVSADLSQALTESVPSIDLSRRSGIANDVHIRGQKRDNITVEVDGLSVGIYNYTIVVYDISGNWVSDEVIVTVIDTTPPMIDHPDDVEYVVGTTGHSITWSPSDAHPSHHVVYRNGTEVASVSWDGSSILVNVDDLSVGVYNYTIVVYDTSGNWVSDIVIVTVLPETTTTTTTATATTTTDTTTTTSTTTTTTTDAGDMTSLGIVLISVSGIGVVVLIVMRYRRGSMTRS